MSTMAKRKPLLSAYDIEKMARQEGSNWIKEYQQDAVNGAEDVIEKVRDFYEAARAKDAELIQRLVDALHIATRYEHYKTFPERWHASIGEWNRAIDAAAAAGFKPSEQ